MIPKCLGESLAAQRNVCPFGFHSLVYTLTKKWNKHRSKFNSEEVKLKLGYLYVFCTSENQPSLSGYFPLSRLLRKCCGKTFFTIFVYNFVVTRLRDVCLFKLLKYIFFY